MTAMPNPARRPAPLLRPTTRVAVIGAGAVGGYFGGQLAAHGHDVVFGARGAHAAAMREQGLIIRSDRGEQVIRPARLLGENGEAGPFDVAMICVKMYDLADAAKLVAPHVRATTAVIPLENGVDAGHELAGVLPEGSLCGGVAEIGSHIEAPGVIRHIGTMARLRFGELDGSLSPRLQAFADACAKSGIEHYFTDAIQTAIWTKFCFLAPFASITTVAEQPIGPVRDDPALWRRFEAMLAETVAVARAMGVALPEDIVANRLAQTKSLPDKMQSSLLTDFQAGRRLEVDWLTGAVVRLGRAKGVPTPEIEAAYAAIKAKAPQR